MKTSCVQPLIASVPCAVEICSVGCLWWVGEVAAKRRCEARGRCDRSGTRCAESAAAMDRCASATSRAEGRENNRRNTATAGDQHRGSRAAERQNDRFVAAGRLAAASLPPLSLLPPACSSCHHPVLVAGRSLSPVALRVLRCCRLGSRPPPTNRSGAHATLRSLSASTARTHQRRHSGHNSREPGAGGDGQPGGVESEQIAETEQAASQGLALGGLRSHDNQQQQSTTHTPTRVNIITTN